jgi:starch-binding outer membrane protein, SusD/RagB family
MNMKIALLCLLIFCSTMSCKKLIEIEETDFIGAELAYKTVENCEQGTIGAYASVNGEINNTVAAILSDELKSEEFQSNITVHTWQYTPDDISLRDFNFYATQYVTIDRCNRVLAALPNADSTRVGDNVLKNRLRAECLFMRAFAHFELWRWFSGNYDPNGLALPYSTISTINPQARINMQQYFQNLTNDLAQAKSDLPVNLNDFNRLRTHGITGLQARVALYMRNWSLAESFASEYINAIPLATRADFPNIWSDASNAELAFKFKRTNLAGPRMGTNFRANSISATNLGVVTWAPSWKLWNSYDQSNDIRFTSYLKNEPLLSSATPNPRQPRIINKYTGTGYFTASENVADFKPFRTGEMYLIRAEARAEQMRFSGANSAETDLNELRRARINGYVNATIGSQAQAITEILNERFLELAFEGHRFWDLKRRNQPVSRTNPLDVFPGSNPTLPAGHFRFVMPIPIVEMQANRLMVQNPNYN